MKIELRGLAEKPKKRKTKITIFLILFFIFLFFSLRFVYSQKNNIESSKTSFWGQIKGLLTSSNKILKGEREKRINILLLGMGGEGHDGPYLTDTIIVLSLDLKNNQAAMFSLPRDLSVNIPEYGWWKINNVNAFGELKKPGQGAEMASQVISEILDLPLHYYARVDFSGFKQLIDDLGGLGIYVERSFTDYQYPDYNHKYKTISFEQGWRVMDGETSLQFSRSRYGNMGEGSDFARSRRQQKVITALKEKILSLQTLINPGKVSSVLSMAQNHLSTNLEIWEIIKLAQLGKKINAEKMIHRVLDNSANGLLRVSSNTNAYMLEPRAGNFEEIQNLAKNIFNYAPQENNISFSSLGPKTKIEIQNGTTKEGLAHKTAEDLQKLNFQIVKMENALSQNYEKTVIYDLSQGKKSKELAILKDKLKANVSVSIPGWLSANVLPNKITLTEEKKDNSIDFLIILGQSAINIF